MPFLSSKLRSRLPRTPFLLAAALTGFFAISLFRVHLAYADCNYPGDERVCFEFPHYVRYEIWQQLALHRIAQIPAAMLGLLPDSMSAYPKPSPHWQFPRYLFLLFSVAGFWALVALWVTRLQSGARLPRNKRYARSVLCLLALSCALFVASEFYQGLSGVPQGVTVALSAFIAPIILLVLSLLELGLQSDSLNRPSIRIAGALLFMGLFAWTDHAMRAGQQRHQARADAATCESTPTATCFQFPYRPSPFLIDTFLLHAPPALFAEDASMAGPNGSLVSSPFDRILTYGGVACYWYLLLSLAFRRWPAQTRLYAITRPVLRAAYLFCLCFALLNWLLGWSAHGPNGAFGFSIAMGLGAYVLRPAVKKSSEEPEACAS